MTDKIDLDAAKTLVQKNTNAVTKFISDNGWFIFFVMMFSFGITSMIRSTYEHRNEVREISRQNAACIYLESSKLGSGQHYMICDGQIVLKRLSDATEQQTPEQKLEEVVPTNATATPTPPTK